MVLFSSSFASCSSVGTEALRDRYVSPALDFCVHPASRHHLPSILICPVYEGDFSDLGFSFRKRTPLFSSSYFLMVSCAILRVLLSFIGNTVVWLHLQRFPPLHQG